MLTVIRGHILFPSTITMESSVWIPSEWSAIDDTLVILVGFWLPILMLLITLLFEPIVAWKLHFIFLDPLQIVLMSTRP